MKKVTERDSTNLPLAFRGNEIIETKLAVDLFQPEVNGIVVEVSLRDTICVDGGGKTGNFGLGVSPTTTSLPRSIRVSS